MGMRMSSFLDWCLWAVVGGGGKPAKARPLPSGRGGLCVLGCTPHVDPYRLDAGILKYEALVEEMAETCDVIVHVGDTKPGRMPCNETLMTPAVHKLIDAGKRQNTLVLYAPGDNELNDCHRHASAPVERRVPSEIITAKDDRNFLVRDLNVISGQDLTGTYSIDQHEKSEVNRATCFEKEEASFLSYTCDTGNLKTLPSQRWK